MAVSDVNSVASSCESVLTHSVLLSLVLLTRETSESGDWLRCGLSWCSFLIDILWYYLKIDVVHSYFIIHSSDYSARWGHCLPEMLHRMCRHLFRRFAILSPPPYWKAWPSTIGPIGFSETSTNNHKHTLRNIPEERRPQLHRGECQKSRILPNVFLFPHSPETGLIFSAY